MQEYISYLNRIKYYLATWCNSEIWLDMYWKLPTLVKFVELLDSQWWENSLQQSVWSKPINQSDNMS